MVRVKRLLFFYILPPLLVISVVAGYEYFVGFPRRFDGKWVHRVTKLREYNPLRQEEIYYAYLGPGKKEVKHGPFLQFSQFGNVTYNAYYKDGQLDGIVTWSNQFGEKTHQVLYRQGKAYGWSIYASGKLATLKEDVFEGERRVAYKTFSNNRYSLTFYCGELIDAAIDPSSGALTHIPDANKHACAP